MFQLADKTVAATTIAADGTSRSLGFDCEGLVRYTVYQAAGHDIGQGTTNQVTSQYLTTVGTTGNLGVGSARPGDLLYF